MKRMRFFAVAALSLAMTTAFGQQGQQGQSGSQGSSGSTGTYQQGQSDQDRSGVQQGQSGQSGTQSRQGQTGTQSGTQSRQGQSGQGSQGQGMGSAEDRVRSEVQWMKSEFNLDAEKEQRLHDVLLKYEKQSTTSGDVKKNKEEKEKEIKAIIGEDNFKIYKEKKSDKDKTKSGSTDKSTTPQR